MNIMPAAGYVFMSRFVTGNTYDYSEAIHDYKVYGIRVVCIKSGYGEV